VPLLNPAVLLPAIVVTDPVAISIERNAELSATKIDVLDTCRPFGLLKDAATPVPSMTPGVLLLPAKVVTAVEAMLIARTRVPCESATYRVAPSDDISISSGVTKDAAVPMPSAEPLLPEPAKTDTVPVGVILLITRVPLSEM
jgi:hypothetical protein